MIYADNVQRWIIFMAESFSFDVVSDFDRQELVNSLVQAKREISQRYDLKGTDTSCELD